MTIVGAEGLDALTIERLAAASGRSEGEVKSHYSTASACLYDTYEEIALSVYHDFAGAFAAERGWRDGLHMATVTLLRRMAARPAEARLCFTEILHGDHELLRRRDASRARLVRLFLRERGKRCGDADAVQMQLELLIGASFQAIAAAVAEDRVVDLEELAPELKERASVFEPVTA